MIKAVLLDLDDTLLHNPNQGFIPHYLALIDAYFKDLWGVTLSAALIATVQQLMNAPRDIQSTNQQILLNALHAHTQQPNDAILAALDDFYRTAYPALQAHTHPIPHAQTVIAQLQTHGYQVVIATNPIYPAEAIRQRLLWAGLSPNFDDYAFVTHAGNTHFAKPSPAYYVEILGRIGLTPYEVVMVGDSLTNDIEPAKAIGAHAYHVKNGDLQPFLAEIPALAQYPAPPVSHQPYTEKDYHALAFTLQGDMGALFGLLDTLTPDCWAQRPAINEWSPIEIVCHLLEREVSQRLQLERVYQTEEVPFLIDSPAAADPCAAYGDDACSGEIIAQRLLKERLETLAFIAQFTPEHWQRPARHSVFVRTSMFELVEFITYHDHLHLKQLCHAIGKCE